MGGGEPFPYSELPSFVGYPGLPEVSLKTITLLLFRMVPNGVTLLKPGAGSILSLSSCFLACENHFLVLYKYAGGMYSCRQLR